MRTDRLSGPADIRPSYLLYIRSGIVDLLRGQSIFGETDNDQFVDGLIFDWAIAGIDTHAKSRSLLLAPEPSASVRSQP